MYKIKDGMYNVNNAHHDNMQISKSATCHGVSSRFWDWLKLLSFIFFIFVFIFKNYFLIDL